MDLVQQAWAGRLLVRWHCTQWCNYSCSYCHQEHSRLQVYKGSPGHWADNHPWPEWLQAFQKLFAGRKVTFHMTGGETLLDKRNTRPLFLGLQDSVELIDLDSNMTFDPTGWDLDMSKVELMASYHPEHTTVRDFLTRLDRAIAAGWNVKHVSVVAWPGHLNQLRDIAKELWSRRLPVGALPYDSDEKNVPAEFLDELRALYLPDSDWYSAGRVPLGKPCLYPSLAYEVDPDGSLIAACHRKDPAAHGHLFRGPLPELKVDYSACPKKSCPCPERYTFLRELNVNVTPSPKGVYAQRLKEHQGCE